MRESRSVNASRASSLPRLVCLLLGLLALPSQAADKPTVAVLYFDYSGQNDELKPLRKGLAQMLITDLSALGSVRLVERERLQEVIDELDHGKSDKFDQDTVVRIGNLLGAQYLVMGSYFDLMGSLRVDARVVQVKTGLIRATGAMSRPDEFLSLEQKLVQQLGTILAELTPTVPEPSRTPGKPEGAKPPEPRKAPGKLTTKTALHYARALDAKDRKDVETAKKELTAAVKEQPDFLLASTDLALLMK